MITGKILRTEESTDGRKNIKIIIEFSEDGEIIVPEWILWAKFENFLGMTQTQISEWIRLNIEHQIGNLILAKNRELLNVYVMDTIAKLTNTEFSKDSVDVTIEANQLIPVSYVVTISDDGIITVK